MNEKNVDIDLEQTYNVLILDIYIIKWVGILTYLPAGEILKAASVYFVCRVHLCVFTYILGFLIVISLVNLWL